MLDTKATDHQPSLIDQTLVSPPFEVSAAAYPLFLFHPSGFAYYLGEHIVPIVRPIMIWLILCPRQVMQLVAALRRRGR